MKRFFNTSSEVAHLFANNLQSEARSRNVFCENDNYYSYGYHFLLCKRIIANEQEYFLVNSNMSTRTTHRHKQELIFALTHKNVFAINFPHNRTFELSDIPACIQSSLLLAKELFDKQIRANSTTHNYQIGLSEYNKAAKLAEIFGYDTPLEPENMETARVKAEHLEDTEKERNEAKRQKALGKNKELLDKWINGEYNGNITTVPIHFRELNNGMIQTTLGAKVNKSRVLILLAKHRQGINIVGEKVSGFTIDSMNETTVKVGCHTIYWQTIIDFFKA